MTIDKKRFLEPNLNTVVVLIQFVGMIAMGGYVYANQTRDIEELRQWQGAHDKTTEGRLAENRQLRGQTEERIKAVERSSFENDRKQDQLLYRVTVLESSSAQQEAQTQKLTDGLSEMSGDLKVVKKILEDMQSDRKRAMR